MGLKLSIGPYGLLLEWRGSYLNGQLVTKVQLTFKAILQVKSRVERDICELFYFILKASDKFEGLPFLFSLPKLARGLFGHLHLLLCL